MPPWSIKGGRKQLPVAFRSGLFIWLSVFSASLHFTQSLVSYLPKMPLHIQRQPAPPSLFRRQFAIRSADDQISSNAKRARVAVAVAIPKASFNGVAEKRDTLCSLVPVPCHSSNSSRSQSSSTRFVLKRDSATIKSSRIAKNGEKKEFDGLYMWPNKILAKIAGHLRTSDLESFSRVSRRFAKIAFNIPKKIQSLEVDMGCEGSMDRIVYHFYVQWIKEKDGIQYTTGKDVCVVRSIGPLHVANTHAKAVRLFKLLTSKAEIRLLDIKRGGDFLYECDCSLSIIEVKRLSIRDCSFCTQEQILDFLEHVQPRELYLSSFDIRDDSGYSKIVRTQKLFLDKEFFSCDPVKRLFELFVDGVEFRVGVTPLLKMTVCRRMTFRPCSLQPKDAIKFMNKIIKEYIEGKRAIFHFIMYGKYEGYVYDHMKLSEGLDLDWVQLTDELFTSSVQGEWGRISITCGSIIEAKLVA